MCRQQVTCWCVYSCHNMFHVVNVYCAASNKQSHFLSLFGQVTSLSRAPSVSVGATPGVKHADLFEEPETWHKISHSILSGSLCVYEDWWVLFFFLISRKRNYHQVKAWCSYWMNSLVVTTVQYVSPQGPNQKLMDAAVCWPDTGEILPQYLCYTCLKLARHWLTTGLILILHILETGFDTGLILTRS